MARALRLLFNLHPGEGGKAGLFLILGLLWSIGSYGSFVLSEGMFLEHVGAIGLPKIYLTIAAAMCLLSAALLFALNRFSIASLLFSLISLWIAAILTFFLFLPHYSHCPAYWYAYKVIGWIIPISIYIVYWAFADQYYDLQDGKRFFSLFNSVTFLGDALGGALIVWLLELLGARWLMLLFAAVMVSALPIILVITRRCTALSEDPSDHATQAPCTPKALLHTIFKSKFTLYLILFYFAMQLVAIVTEFNCMDTYGKCFADKPENALTEFHGKVGMWISLANMFFGMFGYSRLVKKMGINNMIMIAPTFFLAIFSFWFFKDALYIAIFGMVAREGMVYSFDDNNLNLLIAGVPSKTRNHVRIAIESFIEPTGMFAAAGLLFFFQGHAGLLGFAVSLCALAIVLFLRTSYPRAIFHNLAISALRFDKKLKDYLKDFSNKELKKTEFTLLCNLKRSCERGQLIAYEVLLKIGSVHLLPRLLNQIGKLSLPSKLKAIELLSESPWATEPVIIERLQRWRHILPHPMIKSAIHFYLAKHGQIRPERIMQDLQSDHLGLRAASILALKTAPNALQFPSFNSLASEKLSELLYSDEDSTVALALKIIGLEREAKNLSVLFSYLKHPSLIVARAAAKALSLTTYPESTDYAEPLIAYLSQAQDGELRRSCLQALECILTCETLRPLILACLNFRPAEQKIIEKMALELEGDLTTPLLGMVKDRTLPDKCRLLAGKILGQVELKALQKALLPLLKIEIDRAYFYFYHAHTVQKQLPQQDLTILQKGLKASYQSILDFIIQLLGVAGSYVECDVLSTTLQSTNRKIRAQAIESLEKVCHSQLFALLEPLIDDRHPEEKLRHYIQSGGLPLNLTQLLEALKLSSSRSDQIIAIALKAQLKTADWQQVVKEKLNTQDALFRRFASELLEEEQCAAPT